MSDIFFLHMSDEGCFTFIIHHFVRFMGEIIPENVNRLSKTTGTSEYKNLKL